MKTSCGRSTWPVGSWTSTVPPAGKIPVHAWEQEQARLEQEYKAEYEQYKPIQDDLRKLQQVKRNADTSMRQQEQTRQKRREAER